VVRIRLWLLDFFIPINRIKEDLESEFSRFLRQHFFRHPFHYDAESGDDISEHEKERERRRAGPLDPAFVDAGMELPRDDLLKSRDQDPSIDGSHINAEAAGLWPLVERCAREFPNDRDR
jgi:hypothetical protein